MKKAILIFALMAAFAMVLPSCMGNKTKTTEVNDKAKVAYECPMKCEGDKTYDKAGKCPVCQMDLKEVALADKKME